MDIEEENKTKVIEKWDDFPDLPISLLRGIYNYGFENPSQIQKLAILPMIEGRDLIAQAPSGTGKTGAFTIGLLHQIDTTKQETQVIILAPTHELVKQITTVIQNIGNSMEGLLIKTFLGGTSISEDMVYLRKNTPHIIIGSTGRLHDMIRRRSIQMHNIKLLVIDEADEMLSNAFKDQVHQIFNHLNENVQVALFSATIPEEMLQLTTKFMRNPVKIRIEPEKLNLDGIQQYYIAVQNDTAKFDIIKDLFSNLTINQCIIYVNSVRRVTDLYNAMIREDFSVSSIHSSMTSVEREKAFSDFRKGIFRVLISSNVTARGIDIQQVSTVINFDIPKCQHTYLHRIGRSGRWGRKGLAINLVMREDVSNMKFIEQYYKSDIKEFPSVFPSI